MYPTVFDSFCNIVLQEMGAQGGGATTRMVGNTENVDVDLENVSPSSSSRYFLGPIVKEALEQRSGEVGDPEV